MKITIGGIDLAKSAFQVHGMSERGKAVLRKQLKRSEVLKFFANLPPCLIRMEACGGAHHWARKPRELGHEARLMAPQFSKAYVKTYDRGKIVPALLECRERRVRRVLEEALGTCLRCAHQQRRRSFGLSHAAPVLSARLEERLGDLSERTDVRRVHQHREDVLVLDYSLLQPPSGQAAGVAEMTQVGRESESRSSSRGRE